MSKFLVCMDIDRPKVAYIKYDEKSALDNLAYRNEVGFRNYTAKEFSYKPEPKDVEVSWALYLTINGTEFSEVFKTRELARLEKKYIQDNLDHFVEKPYNIYIQREEVWVVDKKKVS